MRGTANALDVLVSGLRENEICMPVEKGRGMKMRTVFRKNKTAHLAILVLALLGMLGLPHINTEAASPWKVTSVPLAGVNGGSNNVVFAFDRFALVAPYAPSTPINEETDLTQLDNHSIHLIDTKKPSSGVLTAKLETATGSRTVYYPTKVLFDPNSQIAYVRGTRFDSKENGEEPVEVVAYLRLNLDDNGKAIFNSNATVIDIKGVGTDERCSDAPTDFALGQNGKLLVFTNGASILTYNVDLGYIYKVDVVTGKFGEDSKITFLDVDQSTDIVTVCWSIREKGEGESFKNSSELQFYHLSSDGSLNLIKRVLPWEFPEGTALVPGSNVAIALSGEKSEQKFAYFVTNDGSLNQIDLNSDGFVGAVKQIQKFDDLAQGSVGDASPRIIKVDSAKRVIGIVKQGFTAQIRRPTNGRPNRPIIRSLSTFKPVEPPAFALVKLSKKGKVVSSNLFVSEFSQEEGLTSFIPAADGQWLLSTHSGNLYSVGVGDDPQKASPQLMTYLGPRTDQIAFLSARSSVVAINSFESNENGDEILAMGSLVVAKMSDFSTQSATMSLQSRVSSSGSTGKKSGPNLFIRRPCNDKKLN